MAAAEGSKKGKEGKKVFLLLFALFALFASFLIFIHCPSNAMCAAGKNTLRENFS
jgi:hypothetical protein